MYTVECGLLDRREVNQEVLYVGCECRVLLFRRCVEVADGLGEDGALVKLAYDSEEWSPGEVRALTLLPASIGTCKNFPETTLLDGRASMMVPGGPTVGCQSWLLILAFVSIVVALCRACFISCVSSSCKFEVR